MELIDIVRERQTHKKWVVDGIELERAQMYASPNWKYTAKYKGYIFDLGIDIDENKIPITAIKGAVNSFVERDEKYISIIDSIGNLGLADEPSSNSMEYFIEALVLKEINKLSERISNEGQVYCIERECERLLLKNGVPVPNKKEIYRKMSYEEENIIDGIFDSFEDGNNQLKEINGTLYECMEQGCYEVRRKATLGKVGDVLKGKADDNNIVKEHEQTQPKQVRHGRSR